MYLQIKAHEFSQAYTCISDVNQQIKYSNLAPPPIMISQLDYDCITAHCKLQWKCL